MKFVQESIGAPMNLAGATPRVRMALLAAAKYRKDKSKANGGNAA